MNEFIEENIEFIQPTSSLYSVPVLLVKKNRLLHLCVDFHDLNCITKKDYYLHTLISDLLDLLYKVYIYIKIDLHYTYYIAYISNGNK